MDTFDFISDFGEAAQKRFKQLKISGLKSPGETQIADLDDIVGVHFRWGRGWLRQAGFGRSAAPRHHRCNKDNNYTG